MSDVKVDVVTPRTEALYRALCAKVGTGPQRWIDALVDMTRLARELEAEGIKQREAELEQEVNTSHHSYLKHVAPQPQQRRDGE